jgi:hypothetical protein
MHNHSSVQYGYWCQTCSRTVITVAYLVLEELCVVADSIQVALGADCVFDHLFVYAKMRVAVKIIVYGRLLSGGLCVRERQKHQF